MTLQHRHWGCLAAAVLLSVGASSLAACGDDAKQAGGPASSTTSTSQKAACGVAEGGEVTIVAKDVAWSTDCLQAPDSVPLTIVIDNRDDGVNHNLHLTAPGSPATKLEAGPITQHLSVGTLAAGDYHFVCDLHPNMTGTLQVLAPLAEGPATTGR